MNKLKMIFFNMLKISRHKYSILEAETARNTKFFHEEYKEYLVSFTPS